MARRRAVKREIRSYRHSGTERVNNPPVGLVTGSTDPEVGRRTYEYDPHLDPQLAWAGKAEHTSFEVPTVSLHVHERIDPRSIIQAVRRRNGESWDQDSLFARPEENPPMRQAVEFYRHRHNWTNRLVAGDSLLVMNSLLEKEGVGGQVQMIYIDPPYGIRYGSNFQPFVNKRDVRDRSDADLTREPETVKAFRDTWELGIHSYLSYLRDRLLLARELMSESGSCFVQISDENVHHVRELMDEIFGPEQFMSLVSFRTKIPLNAAHLPNIADFLVWYAKDKGKVKFRRLFTTRNFGADTQFSNAVLEDGSVVRASDVQGDENRSARYFRYTDLMATGYTESCHFEFYLDGRKAYPNPTTSWKTTPQGVERLIAAGRLRWQRTVPAYIFFADDYPVMQITNQWTDTQGAIGKTYAVQTANKVVERCMLMTTDPGDLVFDPTCGSGTTSYVAEQWGRRWITCDTSRVATTLARQRLMTSVYDYYNLAHPDEGVGSGFRYRTVPHITLGSIANNPDIREGMTQAEIDVAIARHAPQETLYDQPLVDPSKRRVTGPFTVEAVPAAAVAKPLVNGLESSVSSEEDAATSNRDAAASLPKNENSQPATALARSGETVRQSDWRDELLTTGIRGKAGQRISFARLEPQAGTRWLHAVGETQPDDSGAEGFHEASTAYMPQRVAVSFGPNHAPLEQLQVEHAWEEARTLAPRPDILVFAAFQFDPEAAKDIDELDPALIGMQLLKAQMNADLLTDDLKRKRSSNESFWLIGQPDVEIYQIRKGRSTGKWQVEVRGFDYFNTRTGGVESGDERRIAMWMLDPDYDGRSLFARQVFFPMAGRNDGWTRLARSLRAEIDTDLIEAYRSNVSLPFDPGEHHRIAVKIVDDRGIESLRIIPVGR